METHGGIREGAGRPKGAETQATKEKRDLRKEFNTWVGENFHAMLEAKKNLALGVFIEVQDEDGNAHIYQKPPDERALAYCFDQAMGKATQPIKHEGAIKSDGTLSVQMQQNIGRLTTKPNVPDTDTKDDVGETAPQPGGEPVIATNPQ